MPPHFRPLLRLSFIWLGIVSSVFATTVRPPNLDDLVILADATLAGTVTAVRSEWRDSESGRFIHTIVTLRIDDIILGDDLNSSEIELDFLGGTIGERRMTVVGQPQFSVGDQELLFVERNGQQVSPLVRMGYGRYRLVPDPEDSGTIRVFRQDRTPLRNPSEISHPLEHHEKTAIAADTTTFDSGLHDGLSYMAFRQEIVLRAQVHNRPIHYTQLP